MQFLSIRCQININKTNLYWYLDSERSSCDCSMFSHGIGRINGNIEQVYGLTLNDIQKVKRPDTVNDNVVSPVESTAIKITSFGMGRGTIKDNKTKLKR